MLARPENGWRPNRRNSSSNDKAWISLTAILTTVPWWIATSQSLLATTDGQPF
jgi:hypothetical protein